MRLPHEVRVLPALFRIGFAEAVAYRAEFFVWMLSTTMPLIMLALWSAVAREAPVGRFGQSDFIAYFLAFHVRSLTWQIALFLICTVPFWTSNVIRTISWIPLLGRNGLVNSTLIRLHLIDTPIEWLIFSDFSVIVALVHLYTLFMIVPIFNSMMRIDRALIEAARDGGASGWQTLWNVVIPLSKPGIVIGSIFVITVVMGDFVTVGVMGGQQIASVGKVINTQMGALQFPPAAANSVILLVAVLAIIAVLTRLVDIRKEL